MITATEMTIAARMNGMSYGKFVHAFKCGLMTLPPLEEIRARMVSKKREHARVRPVLQYSLKGEYIATFENLTKAAEALEKGERGKHNIGSACLGKSNTAYGFQWRYEGEEAPGVYTNRREIPIRKTKLVDKVCVLCGKPYKGVGRSLYCGKECAEKAKADSRKQYYEKNKPPKEDERICKHCGQEFPAEGKRVFCSERCRIDYGWKAQRERKKAQNRKESA